MLEKRKNAESDLDQISTKSLTSFNQFWHICNRKDIQIFCSDKYWSHWHDFHWWIFDVRAMWMLWYSVNITVKIKVNLIVWWNFWSKVNYICSVYINYDIKIQEWNDASINNLSRLIQDNHWKSLIKKKLNVDKFCK